MNGNSPLISRLTQRVLASHSPRVVGAAVFLLLAAVGLLCGVHPAYAEHVTGG